MSVLKFDNKDGISIVNKTFTNTTIRISYCANITISGCEFKGCQVLAINSTNITIKNNNFVNSGQNGGGMAQHAVQFNKCISGKIYRNYFNEPVGKSQMSDIINIYKSNGTEASPIIVNENYLIGGGSNKSGGGIMLGDNGGDWQIASNNICVNVGQYGMAIAGGSNNYIKTNTVMSEMHAWSNVGIYVWGIPQRGSVVSHAAVEYNVVSWINSKNKPNGWWLGANVNGIVIHGNNFGAPYIVPLKPTNIGVLPFVSTIT